MSHRLAIITVVYQNYIILEDFFDSLCKQTDTDFQLYIIDLSKQKKSITPPSQLKIQVITGENKGYAYGVNLGIKKAIQDGINHYSIVNSDIYFSNNFV
ncbi:glycosyltransferase, partial [Patescibacteria group bacterium]|nr:glycosyltransferase [Patescibacteria group bacterium]